MSDQQTLDRPHTLSSHDSAPIVPEHETDAGHGAQTEQRPETLKSELTQAEARAWLLAERAAGRKPSIRASAAAWHWVGAGGKSRAERLIAKVNAETRPAKNSTLFAEEEAERKRVTAEAVAAIDAARAERARRLEEERDKTFDHDNEDLLVPRQPATSVYWNPYGQVVIIQDGSGDPDEDPYLLISREHVPKLIGRLTAMLKDTAP